MFEFSELKQTRFYQEVFQEGVEQGIKQGELKGRLKAIPPMLIAGLTVEQVTEALDLSVEEVKQIKLKSALKGMPSVLSVTQAKFDL
jgi:predicted transposase/invertase (TIGR01784 family)